MKNLFLTIAAGFIVLGTMAQNRDLQYFRSNDQKGVNVFETSKNNEIEFDGVKVRIGGDFAFQFQALSHENTFASDPLVELGSNFNLPTANLNIDAQLEDGLRVHLRTYLSSRHHTESYVKGGYLQIDKLDWISEGLLSGLMEIATIRAGMDQINYGDTQFRRSDNSSAMYNPFVGNYIMDAFTTEPFLELTLQPNDLIFVAGVTNGRLNQNPKVGDGGMVLYAKAGLDKQVNDDLRTRITASVYSSSADGTRDYIYGGDRAGGRYYATLEATSAGGSDFDPRYNPRFAYHTAFQINPFVKFQGVEFFGVFESTKNGDDAAGGSFTQLGAELLYRFGAREQWFLGGRYNSVTGENTDGLQRDIMRTNFGGGWYMTPNVLLKMELVNQEYSGTAWDASRYENGKFNGFVLEAVVAF